MAPVCPLISMWIAQVLSSDGDTESSTYCRAVMCFSSLCLSCFLSGLLGVCDRSLSLFSLLTSVLLPESHLFVREASGVALHRRKSQMKISIFLEFFFSSTSEETNSTNSNTLKHCRNFVVCFFSPQKRTTAACVSGSPLDAYCSDSFVIPGPN